MNLQGHRSPALLPVLIRSAARIIGVVGTGIFILGIVKSDRPADHLFCIVGILALAVFIIVEFDFIHRRTKPRLAILFNPQDERYFVKSLSYCRIGVHNLGNVAAENVQVIVEYLEPKPESFQVGCALRPASDTKDPQAARIEPRQTVYFALASWAGERRIRMHTARDFNSDTFELGDVLRRVDVAIYEGANPTTATFLIRPTPIDKGQVRFSVEMIGTDDWNPAAAGYEATE